MIMEELTEKGLLNAPEELAEMNDSIDQIELQIGRCSDITHSILKFGRKSEVAPQDVDLRQFIPDATGMVANKAGVDGVEIRVNVSEDTPPVHGDASQLQQVFLNLFNNALDAIRERHGVQGGELAVSAGPDGGGMVRVTVRDNGCGIGPDDRTKIFSPFYTTKPVGKGTGLGLSVCYGIVNAMGGSMEVSSEKGIGTTFTVRLPVCSKPA